ncbi:hypothetical protein [Arthrobacter rhombi]|uniref:hypothetical protein n=1 Tax=Arthrobacter rhombi TaxID=71253 RepID=UPI003FD5F0EE
MNQPPVQDPAKQPDQLELQFLRGRARAFERSGMLENAAQVHSDIEALQFPEQVHRNATVAKASQEEAREEQLGMKQEADKAKEAAQSRKRHRPHLDEQTR